MTGTYEPTWAIIDACVPRGTAEKLARSLCRSAELINRWKRPPEDDENPTGTGALNPIDVLESVQDHAFAHAPAEAHRIHLYFQRRYEKFTSAFAPRPLSTAERDQNLADVVREHAEAMQAVLRGMPADRVRKEWEDLKREFEELVRAVECEAAAQPVRRAK